MSFTNSVKFISQSLKKMSYVLNQLNPFVYEILKFEKLLRMKFFDVSP